MHYWPSQHEDLRDDIDENSEALVKALFVIKFILKNKFRLEFNSFNLEKIDHPLQNDFISCEVMVCYYAKDLQQVMHLNLNLD